LIAYPLPAISRGAVFRAVCSAGPTSGRPALRRTPAWSCLCICPLSLLMVGSSERPAAVQGARGLRGGGESFLLLKRFSTAHPGRRGPFCNIGRKGKGAHSQARGGTRHPHRARRNYCQELTRSTGLRLSARRFDPVAPKDFELVQRRLPMLHRFPFRAYILQRQKQQLQRRFLARKRSPVLDHLPQTHVQ
jgi:hypothetical protein